MPVTFNHTIAATNDKRSSATFLSEVLGLPSPRPLGHLLAVELEHDASIDFAEVDHEVAGQHDAFLITEDDFDAVHARLLERDIEHWSGPWPGAPKGINRNDGGRGTSFQGPEGHVYEVITRPYGSGAAGS